MEVGMKTKIFILKMNPLIAIIPSEAITWSPVVILNYSVIMHDALSWNAIGKCSLSHTQNRLSSTFEYAYLVTQSESNITHHIPHFICIRKAKKTSAYQSLTPSLQETQHYIPQENPCIHPITSISQNTHEKLDTFKLDNNQILPTPTVVNNSKHLKKKNFSLTNRIMRSTLAPFIFHTKIIIKHIGS